MTLRINDMAPDFEAETTQGRIRFHEFLGDSWCVLFSHPKDFTPVCTTELGYMAGLQSQFENSERLRRQLDAVAVSSQLPRAGIKLEYVETKDCPGFTHRKLMPHSCCVHCTRQPDLVINITSAQRKVLAGAEIRVLLEEI